MYLFVLTALSQNWFPVTDSAPVTLLFLYVMFTSPAIKFQSSCRIIKQKQTLTETMPSCLLAEDFNPYAFLYKLF